MKPTRTIVLSAVLVLAAGCAGFPGGKQDRTPAVSKRFYSGAIAYTVDPAAQVLVAKMVKLQGHAASVREGGFDPRSDDLMLPLYRDADINRDHHITAIEAESFYRQYVLDFEDQLGPVVYR